MYKSTKVSTWILQFAKLTLWLETHYFLALSHLSEFKNKGGESNPFSFSPFPLNTISFFYTLQIIHHPYRVGLSLKQLWPLAKW